MSNRARWNPEKTSDNINSLGTLGFNLFERKKIFIEASQAQKIIVFFDRIKICKFYIHRSVRKLLSGRHLTASWVSHLT